MFPLVYVLSKSEYALGNTQCLGAPQLPAVSRASTLFPPQTLASLSPLILFSVED